MIKNSENRPELPLQSDEESKLKHALRKAAESIKELIAENEELKRKSSIAIIGMACRFPGGASTPDKFWNVLSQGIDAVIQAPASRWNAEDFLDKDTKKPGKMYTAQGGFLQEDIEAFDAQFFGITPNEARSMDPQHRLLLEVSLEAFENAYQVPEKLKFSKTGVYIGISGDDYALNHRHSDHPEKIDAYSITGSTFSTAAGRLSYIFGLQGPCMALDTACSSSLVAIHQAIRSLQTKESDLALAGAVNLILHPAMHIGFSKLQAISPDGRCKTFDASANGYVRSEGCA
ncbi:MAG TPA: polyketide synthase, partial [Alcaligenaceae bacterium]|nr:polyketide synthase [Alcaligenaceae bacterium]